uniref:K-box domain-containing protein n=1 Tax=Ananas comosus var. bracteatus TaxID=296719 RepID=A0A6V7QPA8_ANACO|nr:unnamed protein product [Ananas comosus var. bracteatus]
MQKTIERYKVHAKDDSNKNNTTIEQNIQQLKVETASMSKKLQVLESSKKKLLGENLDSCSVEELHQLEGKLEQSLHSIRGKKTSLLEEQIMQLKEKEKILLKENAALREKSNPQAHQRPTSSMEIVPHKDDDHHVDVETELYIGCPGRQKTLSTLQQA